MVLEKLPTLQRLIQAFLDVRLSRWVYENKELIVLVLERSKYKATAQVDNVEINNKEALLQFDECEPWHQKEAMVQEFTDRLKMGETVATIIVEDCLACYAWLNPKQSEAYFPLVHQTFRFPDNSAAIYNVYTHISHRGRGLYKEVLNGIVSWTFLSTTRNCIVTAIEPGNEVALKVNKAMGFEPVAHLIFNRNLGRIFKASRDL